MIARVSMDAKVCWRVDVCQITDAIAQRDLKITCLHKKSEWRDTASNIKITYMTKQRPTATTGNKTKNRKRMDVGKINSHQAKTKNRQVLWPNLTCQYEQFEWTPASKWVQASWNRTPDCAHCACVRVCVCVCLHQRMFACKPSWLCGAKNERNISSCACM